MTAALSNQIQCTAGRLSQLRPEMLRGITQGSAFGIGQQYFAERRVRIIKADEAEIASEVAGAGGLYQQTISLTGGYLITKCTCPSKERPLCRHCVAALLEYDRMNPTVTVDPSAYAPRHEAAKNHTIREEEVPEDPGSNGLGVQLRETAMVIEWLHGVALAVNEGRSLPAAPAGIAGNALRSIRAVQRLDEQLDRSEDEALSLKADLRAQREQLDGLARDLDVTRLELENCRGSLKGLLEKERERDRLAEALRGVTAEMLKKAADADRLAAGLKNQDGRPT